MNIEIQISFSENSIVLQSGDTFKRFANQIAIDNIANKVVDIGHTEDEVAAFNPKVWEEIKHKVTFEPIFDLQKFNTEKMIWATRLFLSMVHREIRGMVPFDGIICHATIPNYESFDGYTREMYELNLETWKQLKALHINGNVVVLKDWKYNLAAYSLDLIPLIMLLVFLSQTTQNRNALASFAPQFPIDLLLVAVFMFGIFWIYRIAWMFSMKFLFSKKVAYRILEQRTNVSSYKSSLTRKLADIILGKLE